MKLTKLNNREQLLIAVSLIVLVLGSYTLFRFMPEQKSIMTLQKQMAKTEKKIKNNRLPKMSKERLDSLSKELNDHEQAMSLIKSSAEEVQSRLASFDSQELKVRISQLATTNRVRIKTNEVLKTNSLINMLSQPFAKKKKKNKKKSKTIVNTNDVILPASMSWIERMSAGTMFHRPMQRIELEGTFQQLRQFIHGLEGLPWQVTVIRLRLEQLPISMPAGYPQPLLAELVVAL